MIKEIYRNIKYNEKLYHPKQRVMPGRLIDVVSAWKGNEVIIEDIIRFTGIRRDHCLEFGVDNGYSSVVFSNFFKKVTGVDIFTGDTHSGLHQDMYDKVKMDLAPYPNIELVKADYRDFTTVNQKSHYDMIHVDIIHTYEDTYRCGLWAAEHADCILFHDTISFLEVIHAVRDISKKTGMKFYHFREYYGLGILCR